MTARRLASVAVVAAACCAAVIAGPAAASWTAPPIDVSPPGQNVSEPEVAVGPDGTATAVWPDNDNQIWAARRSANGAWSAAQQLSGPSSENPDVAAGPDGSAVVVWHDWGAGTIISRRFTGVGWAPDVVVDNPGGNDPRVVIGGDGVATVVWAAPQPGEPSKDRVVARRSTGDAWGAPQTLSGDADTRQPDIAAGPGDSVTVVWRQLDPGEIRANRFAAGAWREESEPVSGPGEDPSSPVVAMGPDGVTTVAWQRFNSGWTVRAARLAGNTWSTPGDVSSPGAQFWDDVAVAAGPGGVAAVAWSRRSPGASIHVAEAARFNGQTWVSPQALSDPAFDATEIAVAVGPDGTATVAWVLDGSSIADFNNRAQARRLGPGGLSGVHVLDPDANNQDTRLAAAPDGAVTAIWRADVESESGVYAVKSSQFRVPPRAPTGVSAVAGDARATVSWSPPALTGGSPITGYRVTATPGGRTCETTGALSCTVTGLTNGIPHTFNVRAINAQGAGPASAESAPVTPMAAVVPDPAPVPVAPVPVPALRLSAVSVTPRVVVRGRPAQTTRTLTIRATLNRQARLRVLFQRQAPGLRRGRACVAPTAALRRAKARRCVRFLTVGSLTRPGRVGVNRVTVTRLKVGRRTLAPGRYRVSVIAATPGSRTVVAQRPLVVRAAR